MLNSHISLLELCHCQDWTGEAGIPSCGTCAVLHLAAVWFCLGLPKAEIPGLIESWPGLVVLVAVSPELWQLLTGSCCSRIDCNVLQMTQKLNLLLWSVCFHIGALIYGLVFVSVCRFLCSAEKFPIMFFLAQAALWASRGGVLTHRCPATL